MGQNIVSLNWKIERQVVKRAGGKSIKTLKNNNANPLSEQDK